MSIKNARKKAGITQKQMSEILKIPRRTIEDWEAGKRTPPVYVKALVIEKLKLIEKDKKEN